MTPSQHAHDDSGHGLSTRSWFLMAVLSVVIVVIGWVLIALLTAKPAPNTEIRERVVELTNSVQLDPSAPSRYEDLKTALANFSAAVATSESDIRGDYDQADIPATLTSLINFNIVREPAKPGDAEYAITLESTHRAIESMEQSGVLDPIAQLLRSPNLANHYGVELGEDEPHEPMILWLLGEVSHFRQYTSAQVARARLASDSGDHQRAADILLEVSPVPAVLTRQAFLIEQLVGNACNALILDEINHLAVQPGLDAAAINTLQQAHRNLSDLGPIDQGIKGERLFIEDIHYATHTASGRYIPSIADESLSGYSGPGTPASSTLLRLKDITGYYFVRRDTSLEKVEELYGGIEAALAEPDPTTRDRKLREIEERSADLSQRYQLLQYVIPALSRAFASSFELRAKLVHSEVLLAMTKHHAETGEWPATVDELVPDYLDEVPADPATNKPIRYRHDPSKPPAIEQIGN